MLIVSCHSLYLSLGGGIICQAGLHLVWELVCVGGHRLII